MSVTEGFYAKIGYETFFFGQRDKSKMDVKNADLEFQIWKFDNKDNAKRYFDVMERAILTNALYEKPPKIFFLVLDELYYFSTTTYI